MHDVPYTFAARLHPCLTRSGVEHGPSSVRNSKPLFGIGSVLLARCRTPQWGSGVGFACPCKSSGPQPAVCNSMAHSCPHCMCRALQHCATPRRNVDCPVPKQCGLPARTCPALQYCACLHSALPQSDPHPSTNAVSHSTLPCTQNRALPRSTGTCHALLCPAPQHRASKVQMRGNAQTITIMHQTEQAWQCTGMPGLG